MPYLSATIRFQFFFFCNIRELLERVISLPKFSLFSYLFADSDNLLNALFISVYSLRILFYLQLKRASITRYLAAKGLTVFLSIWKFRHCFTCDISQPEFALYSYLYANSDIVLKALFLSLDSLCIPLYWRCKRASTTHYFSNANLFVFCSICRFRHRF